MIRRRVGRPGLLGVAARTAVVTGTATAVSNRMQRRAAERDAQQQWAAEAQQQALVDQAAARSAAQQPPAAPAPPAAGGGGGGADRVSQLTALAELKAQGLLTDEEFAAEKARVLNS
ncbi:SHOCT domain-containing protein [Streptomyces filamentosus]|uniref:SHOCT domain-containing protein n=1 Tax=Streptomyces filamentosus TaxID=67294 RepID=UPI00123A2154|nr:SHOCT domain-containing protein [Streptomyces filamentosus]KAA6215884.1 SHOCT domain-containing protein [Streptomyces filamentosus]